MDIAHKVLIELNPKPSVVIEFGTFIGNSALAWGAILRDLHGKDATDLRVCTFELDANVARVARDLIKLACLDDV